MSKLNHFVGSLPFAGRHMVKQAVMGAVLERNLESKKRKTAGTVLFLGTFAVLHGIQAKMGFDALNTNLSEFNDTHSLREAAQIGLDGLYLTANTLVTAAQLNAGRRVVKNCVDYAARVTENPTIQDRLARPVPPIDGEQQVKDTVFTLAGQIAFIGLG